MSAQLPAPPQIFKATYSGVPVYEMMCNGIAVMRRRTDAFMNATQILKVARFDKPKRTRILEREVQTGPHEKVQGGYGKYQGTWVNLNRSIDLAMQYGAYKDIQPLIEYQPERHASPPPAPKHVAAPPGSREPKIKRPRGRPRKLRPEVEGHHTEVFVAHPMPIRRFAQEEEMLTENGEYLLGGTTTTAANATAIMSSGNNSASNNNSRTGMIFNTRRRHVNYNEDDEEDEEDLIMAGDDINRHDMEFHSTSGKTSYNRERMALAKQTSASLAYRKNGGTLAMLDGINGITHDTEEGEEELTDGHVEDYEAMEEDEMEEDEEEDDDDDDEVNMVVDPQQLRMEAGDYQMSAESSEPELDDVQGRSAEERRLIYVNHSPSTKRAQEYARRLLNYFGSESRQIPDLFLTPPDDLDLDMIIDDESHTALHWAAATARIKLVHLLLQRGASMSCLNDHGQTPLTRSVLFSNNFDLKTFPDLLDALQRTVTVRDDHGQTVMHHVALTAGSRGKVHAARYYMDCLLEMLTRTLKNPSTVIDLQDNENGDTALHIAARIGNRIMVRRLLDAGADMTLCNRTGEMARTLILDLERRLDRRVLDGSNGSGFSHATSVSRHDVSLQQRRMGGATRGGDATAATATTSSSTTDPMTARSLYASGRSVFGPSFSLASSGSHDDVHRGRVRSFLMPRVAEMMDQMREECKADLRNQHEQLCETLNLLNNINEKIDDDQKVADGLEAQEEVISKTEEQVQALEAELYNLFEAEEQANWSTLLNEKRTQTSTSKSTTTTTTTTFTELESKETSKATKSLSLDNDNDIDDDDDVDKENANGTTYNISISSTTGDTNADANNNNGHEDVDERAQLLDRINELQQMRQIQLKQLVQLQSNNTSSHRIEDYKQLISRCCDISVDEVDGMLDTLLESIEADEEYLSLMDHQSLSQSQLSQSQLSQSQLSQSQLSQSQLSQSQSQPQLTPPPITK